MNISRAFFITGGLWILVGIPIGMYMGPTQDYTLMPLHAHINLVGFVLSTLFGLVYQSKPAMAENMLGRAHFWLHLTGGVILLIILFFILTARVSEAVGGPIALVGEVMILLGMISYLVNMVRNG